jgi:ectoine hydroxylase-related dioxygenase (phytanoyl-CoA dioxygenase family)
MNILDFIVEAFLWFAVIWLVLKMVELYLVAKNAVLTKQIEEMAQQIKEQIIHVDIEKHGNMFYLYEKDTNRFIAQGTSFDEVKENCEARFKGKSVVGNEDQMNQLGLK